ncbi:MAG TPA: hypothetical protein P5287_07755, partial [bacterium]|nr:hypothetical protein [bacterium]
MKNDVRNARRREAAKVALAMVFFFIVLFGCFLGTTASLSLFLNRVGVALFPVVYMVNAGFMIFMAFVYSLFADRVNNFRIAGIFFAADIVMLLFFRLLLGVSDYYAPMLLYVLMVTITNYVSIQFWAICDNVFSFMDSKRLYSMIGAGGTVGIAAAGFATKYLAGLFHTENLIVVCAAMLGVSLFIVAALRRYADIPRHVDGGARDAARIFREMFGGCRYVMSSRMFMILSAVTGIGFILSFCIDYFYSDLVLASIKTEDGVTAFLGLWSGILNTLTLIMQFFFAAAIITKAGVGNTSVMTPASFVAGYGLLTASYSLPSGIFAKVVPSAARHALGIPAANIMCYLADEKSRVKVRTFISIFVMSLAMLVSGMILKMATQTEAGPVGRGMCVSLLALSAVMLGLSLFLRVNYRRNIFDFLKSQEKVSIFDYLNQFASADKDLSDALVSRLAGAADDDALIVLDVLLKTGFRDRRAAYARLYANFTPAVRAKFISVAGCLGDHDLLREIARGYAGEEESVRITILREFDLYDLALDRDLLLRECGSGVPLVRIMAGKLLFKTGDQAGAGILEEYIGRASCDEAGVLFIREWNNLHIPRLDEAIARCLASHDEPVRARILHQLRV